MPNQIKSDATVVMIKDVSIDIPIIQLIPKMGNGIKVKNNTFQITSVKFCLAIFLQIFLLQYYTNYASPTLSL